VLGCEKGGCVVKGGEVLIVVGCEFGVVVVVVVELWNRR
jgi:hypothetical protein